MLVTYYILGTHIRPYMSNKNIILSTHIKMINYKHRQTKQENNDRLEHYRIRMIKNMNKNIKMKKFIPPPKVEENMESLKRIKYKLEVRFRKYEEIEKEEYIGGNGSVYYTVKKLKDKEKWEEKLQ